MTATMWFARAVDASARRAIKINHDRDKEEDSASVDLLNLERRV
jgi:hypothetical protein